jgi:serine phosphatase RsbU (regulator of sigma subunit)
VIGLGLPDSDTFHQDRVALNPGDRLFFFTDGLFEVLNAKGRQLGLAGFAEVAKSTTGCDLFEVADSVLKMVHNYQFGPNTDDQTLIVAEMR